MQISLSGRVLGAVIGHLEILLATLRCSQGIENQPEGVGVNATIDILSLLCI